MSDSEGEEGDVPQTELSTSTGSRHREGFLGVPSGLFKSGFKKRWCTIYEGNFMWFKDREKQHPIHCIELEDIVSVGSNNTVERGGPVFVVVHRGGTLKLVAPNPSEMEAWIRTLQPQPQEACGGDGMNVNGWLTVVHGSSRKKRWCELSANDLTVRKDQSSSDADEVYRLDGLCTVHPPKAASSGAWPFSLHTADRAVTLAARSQTDCDRWVNALQDTIDDQSSVRTPMDLAINDLCASQSAGRPIGEIFSREAFNYPTGVPFGPVLPLHYGPVLFQGQLCTPLPEVAATISSALLSSPKGGSGRAANDVQKNPFGSLADPSDLCVVVLKSCMAFVPLRNEVLCQLIKLTCRPPRLGSPENLLHWKILEVLCHSLRPTGKHGKVLVAFLNHTVQSGRNQAPDVIAAGSCLVQLQKPPVTLAADQVQRVFDSPAPASVSQPQVKSVGGWTDTGDVEC